MNIKELQTRMELVEKRLEALKLELPMLEEEHTALSSLIKMYNKRTYDPIDAERCVTNKMISTYKQHESVYETSPSFEPEQHRRNIKSDAVPYDESLVLIRRYFKTVGITDGVRSLTKKQLSEGLEWGSGKTDRFVTHAIKKGDMVLVENTKPMKYELVKHFGI